MEQKNEKRRRIIKANFRLLHLIQGHFDRSVSNPEEMTAAIVANPEIEVIYPVIVGRGQNLIEALRIWLENCDGTDSNDCTTCPLTETGLLRTHDKTGEETVRLSYCELFQELEENLAEDKAKKGETHAK